MIWNDERLHDLGLVRPSRRVSIPDGPRDVATLLERPVAERPDAPALITRFERLSFRELDRAVSAAAAYLRSLGVEHADRVAACAGNHAEIVIAFLAVQRLGAIWVGINRNYAPAEKEFLLSDSEAVLFLGDRKAVEEVRALSPQPTPLREVLCIEPGDSDTEWARGLATHADAAPTRVDVDPWAPAAIAYTSGTTGRPKGVVHSQHGILTAACVGNRISGRTDSEAVRATALPLTILNLMILGPVASFASGSRQVAIDRIDAEGIAEWIEREQVNVLSLVPTIVLDLLTSPSIAPDALRSLTSLVAGAAVVPERLPALYEERFGQRLAVGYGLTECPTGVSKAGYDTPAIQGAIGRPHFHLELTIQDEGGQILSDGEQGEICFRATREGPWADVYSGPLGYWNQPEATTGLLAGGWVHTGDIGSLDDAGELFIHDRRNDLIIRGGANIYPAEVERVLRMDPRVRDCAVVGKPEARLGEVPVAFIEPLGAPAEHELLEALEALCADRIARYKIPTDWTLVRELPRNAMGKIVKPRLKERLVCDAAGSS